MQTTLIRLPKELLFSIQNKDINFVINQDPKGRLNDLLFTWDHRSALRVVAVFEMGNTRKEEVSRAL